MITIRFPNGQAIQYNNLNWLTHGNEEWVLSREKDSPGRVFIQPSAGIIVEFDSPCAVYNAINKTRLETIEHELRLLRCKIINHHPGRQSRTRKTRLTV